MAAGWSIMNGYDINGLLRLLVSVKDLRFFNKMACILEFAMKASELQGLMRDLWTSTCPSCGPVPAFRTGTIRIRPALLMSWKHAIQLFVLHR